MAGRPIAMHKFRELILLFQRDVSIKETSRRLGISRNTVRRYRSQLEANRQKIDELLKMEEPELLVWFHPPQLVATDQDRFNELQVRSAVIFDELKGKGVTKSLLWEEYKQECPDGYGYSQFCYHLHQIAKRSDVTMVQHFAPGEYVFIDFAGATMSITDPRTAEVHERQIFVATCGHSHLAYACAVPRQTITCFIAAIDDALQFFGGAPQALVCDNLKAGVIKPDKYEPNLTQALSDLAAHYNMTVMPARVIKPQDKSLVESAVRYFYQRVMAPLRKRLFLSDHDLNVAIAERIEVHNNTPIQRRGVSRRDRYESLERQHMQSLPMRAFELKRRKQLMAQRNNHIWLSDDKTYYSVPHLYVGQRVDVIYTATLVNIYAEGKPVAAHRRTYIPHAYCTDSRHMPPPHQAMASRDVEKYLKWAEATQAQEIYAVVYRVLTSRQFVQQSYRSCDGIQSLYRQYGRDALQRACVVALDVDQCSYGYLLRVLQEQSKNATTQQRASEQIPMMPQHENIRGADYYR